MEKWYFYQDKGKTVGPIEKGELEAMISRGTLGPFDLIYRDGDEKWQATAQLTEFKSRFTKVAEQDAEVMWVVLARSETPQGITYLQRGPFSQTQVLALLKSGEVQYRDFIWKEGQKQWSRISSLDIFNPPPVEWKPNVAFPQDVSFQEKMPASELLKEVTFQQNSENPTDQRPSDAEGEDLVEAGAPTVVSRKLPRSPTHPTVSASFRSGTKTGVTHTRAVPVVGIEKPPQFQWLRYAGAVALIGLLYFFYLYKDDFLKKANPEDVVLEEERLAPVAKAKPTVKVVTEPVVSAKVEEQKTQPIERKIPTFLKATYNSSRGVLEIATDGSMHFPIRVKIVGRAGEILGQVSVFKELTIDRPKNETPELNMSQLELGDGPYEVELKMEPLNFRLNFRLGSRGAEFKAKLNRHRKLISLPFQRERRRLILASHRLSELVEKRLDLLAAPEVSRRSGLERWQNEYADWRREHLNPVSIKNPKALVFPLNWLELDEFSDEVGSIEKENRERVSALNKKAKAIEASALNLSLFR